MEEKILKLDDVIVDNDLNPRQGALDQDAVLDYSAHVDDLPPMHCFDIQGFYYLTRGFHRYAAHVLAMRTEGKFVVHVGNREEAKEDADLDNLKHGLRLTRAERRKVIERQLKRHPDWSDARLAGCCSTTDKTVRVIREELEANLVIPRFDVLTGADGISRPRTISRSSAAPEPDDRQVTLESAAPVAPALLVPVGVLEERAVERDAFGVPYNPTALTDAVMALPDEEKDLAINDDVIYRAMEQEQIAAGLAEAEPVPGWMGDAGGPGNDAVDLDYSDDAGEDIDPDADLEAETQQEEQDDDTSEEPAQAVPGQPEEPVRPVEPAAPMVPPPLPVPTAAPLPPPPPPVVRDAAYHLSITARADGPALVTILQGIEPRPWLPKAVAVKVIEAIKVEPEAEPVVVSDGDGKEWLEA